MKKKEYKQSGAILRVDLGRRAHRTESVAPYMGDYIGGRGVGSKILFEELPVGADPLGPENILIFNINIFSIVIL